MPICVLSQYLLAACLAMIIVGLAFMPFCIKPEYKQQVRGLAAWMTPYLWQSRWFTKLGTTAQRAMLTGWGFGIVLVFANQFGWLSC